MIFNLSEVQKKLDYNFKDVELLRKAFTHASYLNGKGKKNNERLEFLGDSVLSFIVADFLFKRSNDDEGDMTLDKQALVSFKPLSNACKNLKLNENLLVGDKVAVTEKLQENLMESVIGAIYLDGGIEEAKRFVYKNIIDPLKSSLDDEVVDYKSKLNELSSKNRFSVEYKLMEKQGPDNEPTYTVSILIDGNVFGVASASGKRQNAEQIVAKKAFEKITKNKKW